MPLEALRWDVTPIGLHYLLIHYDIPAVDAGSWRLEVDGLVERPLSLSLDELRARPAIEVTVTMECAGNGRAHVEPHVVSQPWLYEAVGTARWRGVPVATVLEEAGVARRRGRGAVHRARPRRRGRGRAGVRAQPPPRATRSPATRCSPTRSTACRCLRSTASRSGWWCPAGTG